MDYNLEEFLFVSVPVLIIALILLLCGLWTRSKYNKKRNNATKATVTSIKVEEGKYQLATFSEFGTIVVPGFYGAYPNGSVKLLSSTK